MQLAFHRGQPWSAEYSFPHEEPTYPVDVLSTGKVKPVPYRFSIDLQPLFAPDKRDANRERIRGALVFSIDVDEPTEIAWHKLEVYGFGGQVKLSGQPVDFGGSQTANLTLQQGSNLVVVDLRRWHDLASLP